MEEAYKSYMRIIKWHVGKYVNEPEAIKGKSTTTDKDGNKVEEKDIYVKVDANGNALRDQNGNWITVDANNGK